MIKKLLPLHAQKYFWDSQSSKIDPRKQAFFISERLIDLGDFEELDWLKKTYGLEFLKNIVKKSRRLSLKSANFFSIYFGIKPEDILCLQKDFRRKHRAIWNH